ncbi:DeoR family transcriptional regulator [Arthrobacter sp. NPDC080073]|uniref:DeoR family transcriptional regulator n=1 Tax=Arthrobacter sp. NPDC080073 TaxID=3155919 RepID=UPI00342B1429
MRTGDRRYLARRFRGRAANPRREAVSPAARPLIPEQRHQEMLRLLRREGVLSIRSLTDYMKVSHMTVRRDITALEDQARWSQFRAVCASPNGHARNHRGNVSPAHSWCLPGSRQSPSSPPGSSTTAWWYSSMQEAPASQWCRTSPAARTSP